MSFNDRKHILGFIAVPINGVYKNVLPFNQPLFLGNNVFFIYNASVTLLFQNPFTIILYSSLGHGIPAIQARFPNEQPQNILLPTVSYPPDKCTPMMKWLKKHLDAVMCRKNKFRERGANQYQF